MNPTNHVLLVRPATFRSNEETAVNNFYQSKGNLSNEDALTKAQNEFDALVLCLRKHHVQVTVVQDMEKPDTPDAIFPNNWFALFPDNKVALFPMFAPNRRLERNKRIFKALEKNGRVSNTFYNYASFEKKNCFLEGTGSMVLDHQNKIAYCALSPRSDKKLFQRFCSEFMYKPISFSAYQTVNKQRLLVYHTNVMMTVTPKVAIICLDAIDRVQERVLVQDSLLFSGKEVIPISEDQVNQFAGNMLALTAIDGTPLLVMSSRAFASLSDSQIRKLERYATLVHSPIPTIENLGGGSVRCMMAEVY